MKEWNAPEMVELNIAETANGFWKIGWEGPFDIVFGDKESENKEPDKEKVEQES